MPTSLKKPQLEAANSSSDSNVTAKLIPLPGESLYRLGIEAIDDNRNTTALEYFKGTWHTHGHPSALIALWHLYSVKNPPAARQNKALITPEIVYQLQLRASSGQAEEQYTLGLCYQYGLGLDKSYPLAIKWYEQAIEQNHARSVNTRASMHIKGQGGAVNYPEAIRLYEQAIELGNTSAMNSRAFMHQDGQGGAINYPEAIRLYEQAIELGNTDAMLIRAHLHRQGLGGAVNNTEAVRLYEQAIELGNASAMNNRAFMHQKGQGGAINYPEAIRLYEQAIALGDASAMNNRAFMHQQGLGGAINYPRAIRLYERAIELGNKGAIDLRAYMHAHNLGNTSEDAASLLSLLWQDLLKGKVFTEGAYTILSNHCKDDILAGLIDEIVDDNSPFYLGVDALNDIANKNHPLAIILGAKDESPSPQYQKLRDHIETLKIDIQRGDLTSKIFSNETNTAALSEPPALIASYLKGSGLFAAGKPSQEAAPERNRYCVVM